MDFEKGRRYEVPVGRNEDWVPAYDMQGFGINTSGFPLWGFFVHLFDEFHQHFGLAFRYGIIV
jgi:hypothetical protein